MVHAFGIKMHFFLHVPKLDKLFISQFFILLNKLTKYVYAANSHVPHKVHYMLCILAYTNVYSFPLTALKLQIVYLLSFIRNLWNKKCSKHLYMFRA